MNREIADRLGCGPTAIVTDIADLEYRGIIKVERGCTKRVVTIRASGKRTAGEVGRPHWSTRGIRPQRHSGAGAPL